MLADLPAVQQLLSTQQSGQPTKAGAASKKAGAAPTAATPAERVPEPGPGGSLQELIKPILADILSGGAPQAPQAPAGPPEQSRLTNFLQAFSVARNPQLAGIVQQRQAQAGGAQQLEQENLQFKQDANLFNRAFSGVLGAQTGFQKPFAVEVVRVTDDTGAPFAIPIQRNADGTSSIGAPQPLDPNRPNFQGNLSYLTPGIRVIDTPVGPIGFSPQGRGRTVGRIALKGQPVPSGGVVPPPKPRSGGPGLPPGEQAAQDTSDIGRGLVPPKVGTAEREDAEAFTSLLSAIDRAIVANSSTASQGQVVREATKRASTGLLGSSVPGLRGLATTLNPEGTQFIDSLEDIKRLIAQVNRRGRLTTALAQTFLGSPFTGGEEPQFIEDRLFTLRNEVIERIETQRQITPGLKQLISGPQAAPKGLRDAAITTPRMGAGEELSPAEKLLEEYKNRNKGEGGR
jgi:hypothetical protein